MRTARGICLFPFATCVLIMLSSGCASMRPEIAGLASRIEGIDFDGVAMSFDVSVRNNVPLSVRVPGGRYALRVSESTLLSSEDVPESQLPGAGVGVITIPAQIRYADLWTLMGSVRDDRELPIDIEGALAIDVLGDAVELPFSHSGRLPVLRFPDIDISSVDTSDVSLTSARLNLAGMISNPNVFDVGISKLGYTLRLGDVDLGVVSMETTNSIEADASGEFSLTCKVSAASAIRSILGGVSVGSVRLQPSGVIETPYGDVTLPASGSQ